MESLTPLLAQNYAEHPYFQFEQPVLSLEPEGLDDFNVLYATLRDRAEVTPRHDLATESQCGAALHAIFRDLGSQTSDLKLGAFLEELHGECHRLLREESAAYRTTPGGPSRLVFPGRHRFGHLSDGVTEQILTVASGTVTEFRLAAENGSVTREDLSRNRGTAVRKIVRILNRDFKKLGLNQLVSSYMGRAMGVTGLAIELSVPQASWWKNAFPDLARPPKTLYAHLDEDIGHPKSIVYLSPVSEETGPTSCYPEVYEALGLNPLQEIVGRVIGNVGSNAASPLHQYYAKSNHQSMTSEPFRRHFMTLPPEMRFNSHFGWDVLPDSPLEAALASEERPMVGSAGTAIVFDGARLIHRGGMVEKETRVALQVVFSSPGRTRRVIRKARRLLT